MWLNAESEVGLVCHNRQLFKDSRIQRSTMYQPYLKQFFL